jgi:hypothetical protein
VGIFSPAGKIRNSPVSPGKYYEMSGTTRKRRRNPNWFRPGSVDRVLNTRFLRKD